MRKIFSISIIFSLSLILVFLINFCINVKGDTIEVSQGESIQDAIDSANEGDIISIASGTYNENIQITKDLTIIGNSKDNTVIDGDGNSHVIKILGERFYEIEVHISKLTIKNAEGTGNDCIAISYVNNGSIENNIIKNSENGDGIGIDHSTGLSINGNTITNNVNGAGISLTVDSEVNEIYSNTIQSNKDGVYIYWSSNNNLIHDNTISGNSQYGIHIASQTLSTGNTFYRNDIKSNSQNAIDPHTNNWDYNSEGNYWGDYDGVDENPENNIGDTPYSIPGGTNKDNYPLGYFSTTQQPIAYITSITPNPATEGESIQFSGTGAPSGEISEVEWKIDGNIISNSEEFSYSSLSEGTYTVKFRVKNLNGDWSNYDEETLTVNQEPDDDQQFSAIITSPKSSSITKNYGEKITFSGEVSNLDQDEEVTSYEWKSNIDGIISSEKNFYKSDLSVGTHTVYFRAKNNKDQWSDSDSITVLINQINSGENNAPVAIPGGMYSGNTNKKISFNGSESYDIDGTISSYSWDFGDGNTKTGMIVNHTYESSGEYNVVLTVTDNMGAESSSTTTVSIQNNNGETDKWVIPGFEFLYIIVSLISLIIIIKHKIKK